MKRKIICLMLALTMLAALAACGSSNDAPNETPSQTEAPAPVPTEVPDKAPEDENDPAETPEPDEGGDDVTDAPAAKPDDHPANGPSEPTAVPTPPADAPAAGGEVSADAENGALALLQKVWAAYPENEKFAAAGGDYSEEHMVEDGPGIFGIADAQMLDSTFGVPSGSAGMIDGAASLMHMMNANTFTCGAFHIKSGEDGAAFAQALKDNVLQRHWMCGFPDKVVIYSVGEYIVSAFGDAEIIDTFFSALVSAESSATLLYDEPIE
jgi:hypothetical protein